MKALKEQGLREPLPAAFVVARINPLRFQRGAKAEFDETIEKMLASAKKFKADGVKPEQLARAGGARGGVGGAMRRIHSSDRPRGARPRGLASRRRPRAAGAPPDLATAKVVDLTHAFDEKTIYWPTSPSAFELK